MAQSVERRLYVLLDAEAWFEPLRVELAALNVVPEIWNLTECSLDLCSAPPEGVFLNRVSASCHARGHRQIAEYGRQIVLWLQAHGRRVLNGGRPAGAAIDFELSKVKQMQALGLFGIRVPESVALSVPLLSWSGGIDHLFPVDPGTPAAAVALGAALERLASVLGGFSAAVVKPNCGGRGLGVTKLEDAPAAASELRRAAAALRAGRTELPAWLPEAWPVDGVLLVQRLVRPEEPAFITRIELVGCQLGYAQRTDISDGATQLCTADACAAGRQRFSWRREITAETPLVKQCASFAAEHGLDVAGFEFIEEAGTGECYVYDINPNTNYSSAVQQESGMNLYAEVAKLCSQELQF